MGSLGVLFAVDETTITNLKEVEREALPDYIGEELEEKYFATQRQWVEELDKSWDAMHRVLSEENLYFETQAIPLGLVVLGGTILYGDRDSEEDYIISLKNPEQVKEIAVALQNITKEEACKRYYEIDADDYGFPLSDEDFEYTWAYMEGSIDFWKRASQENRYVLFTVDQ